MSGIPVSERHGHAARGRSPEYQAWSDMRARCYNSKHKKFGDYGGRGIDVCQSWKKFVCFFNDMGARPEGMTLERLKNDEGYTKHNCVWAPQSVQMRNQRRTNRVTIDGETLCVKDWAQRFGIAYTTVQQRVYRHGWDYLRALTTPVDPGWRIRNLGVSG